MCIYLSSPALKQAGAVSGIPHTQFLKRFDFVVEDEPVLCCHIWIHFTIVSWGLGLVFLQLSVFLSPSHVF